MQIDVALTNHYKILFVLVLFVLELHIKKKKTTTTIEIIVLHI